jgi:hypothetical protein
MSYFQHDTDATNDPKIIALLGKCGGLGYGIFWRIVEILHKEPEHKIEKENYFFDGLAQQMSTDVEQILTVVKIAISYKIFYEDEKYIWSKRVFKNFEERNKVIESKRKAGLISAQKRTGVEQVSTGVEQVSTNKVKEIKEKKIKKEDKKILVPTREECLKIYKETAKELFNQWHITLNLVKLDYEAEEFINYWIGDEEYPGKWFTEKKYKGVRINPKSTAIYNISNFKKDTLANYDIPYKEPEPEKTAEEIAEIEKRKAQSKKEFEERLRMLNDKYKDTKGNPEPVKNSEIINSFADNLGRI